MFFPLSLFFIASSVNFLFDLFLLVGYRGIGQRGLILFDPQASGSWFSDLFLLFHLLDRGVEKILTFETIMVASLETMVTVSFLRWITFFFFFSI